MAFKMDVRLAAGCLHAAGKASVLINVTCTKPPPQQQGDKIKPKLLSPYISACN